jgi:phospholipid transport system transporter-binding protein
VSIVQAPTAETFMIEGPLSFESLPGVLAESAAYAARTDLPERLVIDFSHVTTVDSSAVALLLDWRRQAQARAKTLEFANLPPTLLALARLYGVSELIQPQAA